MDMMDMDLEDEESADKQDSHHCGRTQLSINTPTSTNIVVTAPSPSQEGFVEGGGFGRGSKSVLHPTLSPRFPVGAGPNTCGDPGVGQSRLPEWCGRDETPQAEAAEAASTAIAAGKVRSRKECGDCGSVIGRWGAVVPSGLSQERSNRALSGKSCESCGGYVVVERESKGRMQDWSKTSSTLTTPSASETTVQRTLERGSDNGGAEGEGDDQRRTPSGTTAIAFPVNEDGGSRGDRADDGDHSGLVHSAKRVSQEARLASVAEDERQAGRTKQRKRGREEEDSAPATPLSSARSSLAHRRRGNDLIARMPRLSWGQSGDDSSAHTARRASNGSVGGGGGGGGGGVMTATPVDTRSDPPSDPVSKRRKSDHSHGDSSPFKSSVMVAARSKYRIVQHRGFSESGEMVGGSSGCADSAATGSLDEPIVTGASRQTTYSPGISKSSSSSNRRHDSRSIDTNSAYRRRYRDECSNNTKNTPRRRQGTAPSPLHKRSPEATGTCAAPRTPTSTVAVQGADSTVDPAVPVLVVIDGSNVAFSFRQDVSNPRWSPQGILLALKFFQERGVPVVAFVPRPRVDSIAPGSEDYDAFMEAMRSQAIATVPSKANDDLFILLYAIQRSAHIVTNDQFRDHLANASTLDSLGLTKDELRTFLLQHHVSYTFARDEFVANPEAAIIRVLTLFLRCDLAIQISSKYIPLPTLARNIDV